jgi:murein DD-endopeptidase MepM/ murein hydrolase activator NlpD
LALLLAGCPAPPPDPDPAPAHPDPAPANEVVEPDPSSTAPAPALPHAPPGELLPNTANGHRSVGVADPTVHAEEIRFPIESGPAFANSQIFGAGGNGYGSSYPPPGGQENSRPNFSYPWRDNFCEVRSDKTNPACAGGLGHQGQDIRPPTCAVETYWIVAPERSTIAKIGDGFLLELHGLETGNVYRLLHMDRRKLAPVIFEKRAQGTPVERGERLAKVSNILTPDTTTTHLHFEIKKAVVRGGGVTSVELVSPYTSLVEAYLDLLAANPAQFDPVATLPPSCAPL